MAMHATKLFKKLLFLTAIIALGLRSLIPVGYMPDFSVQGKGLFPVTICDGLDHTQETMDMGMPMDHAMPMHHHHDGAKHGSDLCAFGINAVASNPPGHMDMALQADYGTAPVAPVVHDTLTTQPDLRITAPRAPPFFS